LALGCLEKYEEEIECYQKALEIDPEYEEALNSKRETIAIMGINEQEKEKND